MYVTEVETIGSDGVSASHLLVSMVTRGLPTNEVLLSFKSFHTYETRRDYKLIIMRFSVIFR